MTTKSTNFGDFTEAGQALDLYGNAIRQSIATDVYKNTYTFSVVVLTKPLPMSQNGISVSGFKFKGRILDPATRCWDQDSSSVIKGPPSPHRFLPDPCKLSTAVNAAQAIKIIALHTEFAGPAEGQIPNPGDEVIVQLQPGDYSYNVARATFTKLTVKNANRNLNAVSACSAGELGDLFEDGAGSLLGPNDFSPRQYRYLGNAAGLNNTIVENGRLHLHPDLLGTLNTDYSAHAATMLKDTLPAWDALAEAYHKQFKGEKFPAQPGGGYRTFEKQLDARQRHGEKAAKPGRSNHGLGVALDISSNIVQFGNDRYQWLFENSKTYQIIHPCWARQKRDTSTNAASRCNGCPTDPRDKCGTNVEVWHWEITDSQIKALLARIY